MKYDIITTKENYFKESLKVLNGFLKLSKTEFNVLVNILLYNKKVFDTEGRLTVRNLLGQTENNMNNHIMRLKKKGVLIDHENGVEINHNIISSLKDGEIIFKFNIRENVHQD